MVISSNNIALTRYPSSDLQYRLFFKLNQKTKIVSQSQEVSVLLERIMQLFTLDSGLRLSVW